jgi:hypothetical protein
VEKTMNLSSDARQFAPATQRNRDPILQVLQRVLPASGTVLEVASGTGEHAVYFAPQLPLVRWLPSDANPLCRESIRAWQTHAPAENLLPPIELDVTAATWPVENLQTSPVSDITAIVSINLIHISPWRAGLGLMAGAGRILPAGGILYLYGPYKQGGQHTAPSNEAFDHSLRSQNPEWGVRDLETVIAAAEAQQLEHLETVQMPANNLSVIFQHQ